MKLRTTTKNALGAQILNRAALHLMETRKPQTYERAYAILTECERYCRNGFRTPITYEYFGFDSDFYSNGEWKPLYRLDSVSVLEVRQ